jgi:hypothetical protein
VAGVDATRFNAVAAVVGVAGPLVALAAVFAFPTPVAYRGSIALSALVTLLFAGHGLASIRRGAVSFASAAVTALLGVWLAVAPVVYDAGFLPTAVTQFAGLLVATFSLHAALDVVGRALGDDPAPPPAPSDDPPAGLGDVPDE